MTVEPGLLAFKLSAIALEILWAKQVHDLYLQHG
jgi:hypothetical protein